MGAAEGRRRHVEDRPRAHVGAGRRRGEGATPPLVSARQEAAMRAIAARHKLQLVGCAWFWAYALVGAALVLGGLSLGPLLFIPTAIAMWLLARRHAINGFG